MQLNVPLPNVLHEQDGEIRVKGTRISLYHIITAYNEKWMTAESMVFHYPTVSYHAIQSVLDFYQVNQTAVDQYVREYKAELQRQEALYSGQGPTREELLRRLEEKRRQESRSGPQAEAG